MQPTTEHRPIWRDGRVPVSPRFDDPYYSIDNGLAETEYVFLGGNDLPTRFAPGFRIAELGFGTGLNLLTVWRAWRASGTPGRLYFTSFEAFPLSADDTRKALANFPEVAELAELLLKALTQGQTRIETPDMTAEIILGDARETLPRWTDKADAWFLDGFAPAKNPELWEPALLAEVARHTAPGGTAATYTAAGAVRRAMEAAGFAVERRPGFGRKRHMTTARLI